MGCRFESCWDRHPSAAEPDAFQPQLCCAKGTAPHSCRAAVDLPTLCRAGTSPQRDKGACYYSGVSNSGRDTTMTARVARSKTKRLPSTQKKAIPATTLAQRLAEVQALRKLVQKAEASRAG